MLLLKWHFHVWVCFCSSLKIFDFSMPFISALSPISLCSCSKSFSSCWLPVLTCYWRLILEVVSSFSFPDLTLSRFSSYLLISHHSPLWSIILTCPLNCTASCVHSSWLVVNHRQVFNYHFFSDNAITHFSSPDLPPELQNPILHFVLDISTWMFYSHLRLSISKRHWWLPPHPKPISPSIFLLQYREEEILAPFYFTFFPFTFYASIHLPLNGKVTKQIGLNPRHRLSRIYWWHEITIN